MSVSINSSSQLGLLVLELINISLIRSRRKGSTSVFKFMPAKTKTHFYHTRSMPNVNYLIFISVHPGCCGRFFFLPSLLPSKLHLCLVLHWIPNKNLFIMKGTECLELHRLEDALVKVLGRGLAPACFPAAPCFHNLNSTIENLLKALKKRKKIALWLFWFSECGLQDQWLIVLR